MRALRGKKGMQIAKRRHRGLLILILLFITLSFLYNVSTPIGESDNELSHFRYIQYIWLHHRLPPYDYQWPSSPRARCSLAGAQVSHQFRQPPLYYVLNALAFSWLDLSDTWWPDANPYGYHARNLDGGRNAFLHTPRERFPYHGVVLAVHLIRAFSTLLGVILLLITYAIGRLLFQDEKWALPFTAMVMLTPAPVFAASVINNDILVAVLAAAALYFALRGTLTPSLRMLIPAGGLFGLALLAKYTAILVFPTLLLAAGTTVVRTFRPHTFSRRQWLYVLLGLLIGTLPVIGWFWWNWIHYGHPLPGYAHQAEVIAYHWRKWRVMPWSDIRAHVWEGVTFSFISYWGLLGADALTLPPWMLNGLALVWAVIGLGGIRRVWRRAFSPREIGLVLLTIGGVSLAWLAVFIAIVYAPRGRYILALYPLLAYLLVFGLRGLTNAHRAYRSVWAYAILVSLISMYAAFGVIRPAFSPPNTRQSPHPEAGEWPIHATVDTLAEIISVRVSPQQAVPGDELTVTIRWRVLRETENNYVVGVHLQGLDRSYMGGTAHWPANGRYATSLWKKGDVFLDTYHFRIHPSPRAHLPQGAQVLISMYCQSEEGDRGLPIYDGQGTRVGVFFLTPPIRVGPLSPQTSQTQAHPLVRFGDEIAVLDVEGLPNTPMSAPGSVDLHVRLRTLTKPRKDYTMYIQIVDRQNLWLTVDSPLGGGMYPSHLWIPGEVITHTHPFPVGMIRRLPKGTYYLIMGLYDGETGRRLPPQGEPDHIYADSYLLTTWTIPRILHAYIPYIGITDNKRTSHTQRK